MVLFAPDFDVDVELFRPHDQLSCCSRSSTSAGEGRFVETVEDDGGEELAEVRALYDTRGIDAYAPHDLSEIDPHKHRIVCFVGKLIVSKGVDLVRRQGRNR